MSTRKNHHARGGTSVSVVRAAFDRANFKNEKMEYERRAAARESPVPAGAVGFKVLDELRQLALLVQQLVVLVRGVEATPMQGASRLVSRTLVVREAPLRTDGRVNGPMDQ